MKNREMIGSMAICDLLLKINMKIDDCVLDAFTDAFERRNGRGIMGDLQQAYR